MADSTTILNAQKAIDEKLSKGLPVYLKSSWDDMVFRYVENHGGCYAKTKGRPEWKLREGTDALYYAYLEPNEITKEEYENY